jgi:hypothetical protein
VCVFACVCVCVCARAVSVYVSVPGAHETTECISGRKKIIRLHIISLP